MAHAPAYLDQSQLAPLVLDQPALPCYGHLHDLMRGYQVKDLANEREQRVPQVGDPAPDFELERLTGDGKRSDQRVRLSSLQGKPVLLYFGSYT